MQDKKGAPKFICSIEMTSRGPFVSRDFSVSATDMNVTLLNAFNLRLKIGFFFFFFPLHDFKTISLDLTCRYKDISELKPIRRRRSAAF